MKRNRPFLATLTLMLLASALTCLIIASTIGRELGFFSGRFGFVREYAALLSRIDELYIGDYDEKDVAAAANGAAVYSLGDRWSFYMTPEEYVSYLDSVNNRFVGIGIIAIVDEETGGMLVNSVYRGSAAEAGGLAAGDIIIGIDGEDITSAEFEEMRLLLSRQVGESVDLTVKRAGGVTEKLTVIYSYIFVDPVIYEMMENGIGYIQLANFENGSASSFIAAVDDCISRGAFAFIFDVRSNGGGKVAEMTRILDYLLPEGEIFVAVDRGGTEEITKSGPGMIDMPCVVLVDRYSFSAAEYFAATLKEYGYASVVGEQTTGKDRSQVTVTLPGGGALHISSAKFLTKDRVSLYEVGGLTPDHQVGLTDDEFELFMTGNLEKESDPQFLKAVELLNGAPE